MSKWSNAENTAELTAHGQELFAAAAAWLEKYEPDFLRESAVAVVGAALQAVANAQAVAPKHPVDPMGIGNAMVHALAHQVAIICLQQADIEDAFGTFAELVGLKLNELVRDRADLHMIGGSLPTQGNA